VNKLKTNNSEIVPVDASNVIAIIYIDQIHEKTLITSEKCL
jgi:hypothetical protein